MTEPETAVPPPAAPRTPRPDAELKQLAIDVFHGRVLTSQQVPDNLLSSVFMILALSDREQLLAALKDAAFIYADLKDAGPRSINGFPIFLCYTPLYKNEADRFFDHFEAYKALQADFLKPPETSDAQSAPAVE